MTARILAFASSTREESFNKKLVRVGAKHAAAAGADVTVIDLRDYPMPLYDGDLEQREGLPEAAGKLKDLMSAHHGFLLSCAEYNASMTAVFKNTIDWVSRRCEDERPLENYRGKVVALLSASPGALGGLRGLVHVRSLLSHMGCLVLPDQHALSNANKAFTEEGDLRDAQQDERVQHVAGQLVTVIERLHQS